MMILPAPPVVRSMRHQMQSVPFQRDYSDAATALLVDSYTRQRLATPMLPAQMEDPGRVAAMLDGLFRTCPGVMVLDNEQLLGYLGWFLVDDFRGTIRKGA